MTTQLQATALHLLETGYHPVRIEPGQKRPIHNGWQRELPTEVSLTRDFSRPSNIGILMGIPAADGTCLIGIDVDVDDAPLLGVVAKAIGAKCPQKLGRKGGTYFVRFAGDIKTRKIHCYHDGNKKHVIDILGPGSQSVIPPSIHPDTKLPYQWLGATTLTNTHYEVISLIDWTAIDEIEAYCKDADSPIAALNEMEWRGVGGGGNTHDICVAAAAAMVTRGWSDDQIHARLRRAKSEACERAGGAYDWPGEEKAFQEWIDSARAKFGGTQSGGRRKISHGLLADAFLAEVKPQIRYDWRQRAMARFDGNRWVMDQDSHVRHMIERFLPPQLRNRNWVEGVFKALCDRPEIAVHDEVWDLDAHLSTTPGGTVDLQTGKMRPADPRDMITKSTAVAPDFDYQGSLWLEKLGEWVGSSSEELDYFQRLAGYFLTGETREQCLSLFIGPGEDGKSTWSNIMAYVMGDYAGVATDTVFLGSRFRQHSEELAMLRGYRLVQLSEMGGQWDEGRIKQVTGGDGITAAFKNAHNFTYHPSFKLLVTSNEPPRLKSVGRAMTRRFHVCKFNNRIENIDRTLEDRLKKEAAKILGWAIDGAVKYYRDGLPKSPAVIAASNEYFLDSDFSQQWIEDCCEVDPEFRVSQADAYENYRVYLDHIGRTSIPDRSTFVKSLIPKNIVAKRAVVRKGFDPVHALIGLRLKSVDGDTIGQRPDGLREF